MGDHLTVGRKTWTFEKYNEATGAWTNEGDYPAPIQEEPISEGRTSTLETFAGSDGRKIVVRRPERSQLGTSRMRWFREASGAAYAIFAKLNEWIRTGAGLRITRHDSVVMMGYFRTAQRKLIRSVESEQDYEPVADFEHFAVDGTGAGW
jgi:hypothetical protein